ncbi:MAG: aminotransferase class V-fold PLP-dependent enzyme [Planctomycetes bacterium]|nr:aminotransferase class V-fold PLP-dependent enzyme [Planctomycetota bacterium]
MNDRFAKLREEYPICQEGAYFQWAYRGALSRTSCERLRDLMESHSMRGAADRPKWFEEYARVGQLLAQAINAPFDRLAYTPNTAWTMGMIAQGLHWQRGDEVLIPEGEFPSNVYPWMQLDRLGVTLRVVKSREGDAVNSQRLLDEIRPNTKLIAASHVSFHNGYRLDIEGLCQGARAAGVWSVIDAAQSVGWCSLDLQAIGADAFVGVGRKFLCGLDGLGFVALSEGMNEELRLIAPGPFSVKHQSEYLRHMRDWREDAGRFAGGGIASPQVFALGASLELFEKSGGFKSVEPEVLSLVSQLRNKLQSQGIECLGNSWSLSEQSAVLKVLIPHVGIEQDLGLRGISVSERPGGIRVSLHAMNSASELDMLVDELSKVVA